MSTLHDISLQVDEQLRTDKSQSYLDFYGELLTPLADKPLNFLEVGVLHGGALLMFARYLPHARFLGIDINPPPSLFFDALKAWKLEDRVHVVQGSQDDKAFVRGEIQQFFGDQRLDVVIDDASHMYRRTKATFDHVFYDFLRPGGYYFIEDWGCGYWPKWPDGNANGRRGLPRLIKELVDLTALEDRTLLWQGKRALRVSEVQLSPIDYMIVRPSVVAIKKSKQTP